ncbi:hypothetical protein [Anatilimnocola floriformis]|uniref:hypothetical protein n=1 Tax=Anatilimnocola floriformis TaxID=2948575 RepID=UPI0020C519E4|nr:hypothetical protein [Anatilimnocola floriformis]
MQTILEGRCKMSYFTDLRMVFQAINNSQRHFNWLITDLQCLRLSLDEGLSDPLVAPGPHWLTGDELTELVATSELQFIWAVLSGFSPSISLDLGRLEIEPYADGNPNFWVEEPRIQHPLAELEIVCWDATSTLLLSRDPSISEQFRQYFPEAIDLADRNKARSL